jgi:hypothetical protein
VNRVFVAVAALLFAQTAFAQQVAIGPFGGRIGIEESVEQPPVLADVLERARFPAPPPVFVRLSIGWSQLERAAGGNWAVLDQRVDDLRRRSVPVLIAIGPRDPGVTANTWADAVRAMALHLRGRVVAYQIESDRQDAREYAFALKLAAVQLKAVDPDILVAQATVGTDRVDWLRAVYAEGTAAYTDIAAITDEFAGAGRLIEIIGSSDPTAIRLRINVDLGASPDDAFDRLMRAYLDLITDSRAVGSTFRGNRDTVAAALAGVAFLSDLFSSELQLIDDAAVSLSMTTSRPEDPAARRLLFNVSTGTTYLVFWTTGQTESEVSFALTDQGGRVPVIRDVKRRQTTTVEGFSWDPATSKSRMTARATSSPTVIDFSYGSQAQFVSRSDVKAAASLSVEEIVARNQQAQTRQSNSYRTLIGSLLMSIHFRPTSTQVFDVVSENRYFSSRDSVEWEELTFSVNGTKWGPNHPGIPLVQAEKVITLPLDLHLTAAYRYRLEGSDTIDGRRCYVVSFEPAESGEARYRGRVWIDVETFIRLKLQTIQSDLTGPIVSSEEIALYAPVRTPDGGALYLVSTLISKQSLLIAGRNLLLEKEQRFTGYRVDAPEFESERRTARASEHVMFRDTDVGVRYLVKRGDDRVVSDILRTSSKAMAMGVTIDPAFAFPLPILGLNYLNFDVKGTGGQFAMLFAGVFIAGNLQTPRLAHTPFDASIDFFGIAVPGTDVIYDATGERKAERVLNIPTSVGANLGYQVTPFQKLGIGYTLRHDVFFHAPETAEDFQLPGRMLTHGVRAGYEYSRRGYRAAAAGSLFSRSEWHTWGLPGDFNPEDRTYERYTLQMDKDFLFGPFQSIHAGAAWYGGRRLDRFSMYQFGLFDEWRMHGVPSAGIRFPELLMLRASYSLNIFDVYRLDLFLDHARGRDPNDAASWRPVTGTGVAITMRAPWQTMLTVDVGKAFIPGIYRGTGSFVAQILLLKPLGTSNR